MSHKGKHHYAVCGEWRPAAENHECTTCPAKCPACGTYRNVRRDTDHPDSSGDADRRRQITDALKGEIQHPAPATNTRAQLRTRGQEDTND